MRITRIDLAGTNLPDSPMPRAVAVIKRPAERGYIYADVFKANGRSARFTFPPDYNADGNATRCRQACYLADELDGNEHGAKTILQVVETMIEMAGPAPAKPQPANAAEQDDKAMVEEMMQNAFTPEAVAAVAWGVRRTITNDKRVQRQLDWLATILENMVGGPIEHEKVCDELGLER